MHSTKQSTFCYLNLYKCCIHLQEPVDLAKTIYSLFGNPLQENHVRNFSFSIIYCSFMLSLLLILKQITIQQQDMKVFLLPNIHTCASQAPYVKLLAPRDIHMTSHFGYLVLLITQTLLSGPVRFEITSVDCIFSSDLQV